jgi:hypothetical protein
LKMRLTDDSSPTAHKSITMRPRLKRSETAMRWRPNRPQLGLPTQNVGTIWEHLLFLTALSALESLLSIPENAS